MNIISDILEACGNLPRWFVAIAIIAAFSVTIITVLGWNVGMTAPILWASTCVIAIHEGNKKVIAKKIQH